MFDCANVWGHWPEAAGNPCTGMARYRRPPRGLLLLLTRCRPGEIRCLRWCEVKPDRLALIDAKMGPRHVPLGVPVPELLSGLAETAFGG